MTVILADIAGLMALVSRLSQIRSRELVCWASGLILLQLNGVKAGFGAT